LKRIRSISDLEDLRKSILKQRDPDKITIRMCLSTGCRAKKSIKVISALEYELNKQGLQEKVEIKYHFYKCNFVYGFIITRPVMALAKMSPTDKYAVSPINKSFKQKNRIYPSSAHNSDHSYIRRILESCYTC